MKWLKKLLYGKHAKISYSQTGEDLIVDSVMASLDIPRPSYIDIGAHDPVYLSNTYIFYRKGCRGVCVEPDPVLHKKIVKKRPGDVCLNIGIGASEEKSAPFYIMSTPTLNTFSREEAERYQGYGRERILNVVDTPLVSVNRIVKRYFPNGVNFISLDVEGMDFPILKSIDFASCRPQVLCVETLTYTEDKSEEKIEGILSFMTEIGYLIYADTYLNTIFVDKDAWLSRR